MSLSYDPTPEEIAASCRQIQSEWDANEFRRRAGHISPDSRWLPPTVRLLHKLGREYTALSVDALYVGHDPERRLS